MSLVCRQLRPIAIETLFRHHAVHLSFMYSFVYLLIKEPYLASKTTTVELVALGPAKHPQITYCEL